MTAPIADFPFGGRLSLDLTWTLRYRAIAPTELLSGPGDLRRWITTAIAPLRSPPAEKDLIAAVELRESIYRSAIAVIEGRRVRTADRTTINDRAAQPSVYRRLDRAGRAVPALRAEDPVGSALAAVAIDAVGLLAADDGRLRLCQGPGCSLLFYDTSRPGRRRWCSTERCGNRVNTTTYRQRRRAGGTVPS